jgi:hypothetical protein
VKVPVNDSVGRVNENEGTEKEPVGEPVGMLWDSWVKVPVKDSVGAEWDRVGAECGS